MPLTNCNLNKGADVHEDCRCIYRDCRTPLLNELEWRQQTCPVCWVAGGGALKDPDFDEPVFSPCKHAAARRTNVKLGPLPRRTKAARRDHV